MLTQQKNLPVSVFILFIFTFTFMLSSCQKEVPPKNLNVKILDVNHTVDAKTYRDMITVFAQQQENVNANVEYRNYSFDQIDDYSRTDLAETDVVIASSYLNPKFRNNISSYYPLSTDMAVIPDVKEIYQTAQENQFWAIPLTMDKLICIAKKEHVGYLGRDTFGGGWQALRLVSITIQPNNLPLPHIAFYGEKEDSIGDTWAAIQYNFGYKNHVINPVDNLTAEIISEANKIRERGTLNIKNYLVENGKVEDIPVVNTIDQFMNNRSFFFTFVPSSVYKQQPDAIKNKLHAAPIPSIVNTVYSGTVTSILIPIEAMDVDLGKSLVSYITQNISDITSQSDNEPLLTSDAVESQENIPDYIVKEEITNIGISDIRHVLNQEKPLDEINEKLDSAFVIPNEE